MPPRKRIRKRKRRNVSSSSSSSSSSTSSDSDASRKSPIAAAGRSAVHNDEDSDSDSSSSSSSSSSTNVHAVSNNQDIEVAKAPPSRSPTPPSTAIPPLLPPQDVQNTADIEKEKELKDKFRQFWMASIADAFSDDLEEIRKVSNYIALTRNFIDVICKEPNMTQSKLSLLIDSLASGADVFEKGDMESVVS